MTCHEICSTYYYIKKWDILKVDNIHILLKKVWGISINSSNTAEINKVGEKEILQIKIDLIKELH